MYKLNILWYSQALDNVLDLNLKKTRDQGRSTRGVRGIKFKIDTDFVVDADVIGDSSGWVTISPDQHGDWLRQRDGGFDEFFVFVEILI